ncbi:MAG: Histidine kinase [Nocardioides sp.]|nr:Histidine kinase [Nocardioides sp.]
MAAGFAVASLLTVDVASIDTRLHPADPFSVAATLAAGLSLAWRRTRPATSFVVFVVCSAVVSATFHYIGLLSVLLLPSIYSLAVYATRRVAVLGLGFALVAFLGLALLDVPDLAMSDLAQAAALLVAAFTIGDAVRSRRAQHADQVRTAEQEAATARAQAGQAVIEERLRIARELHDVVAHSMSLIAVQAGVGAHVIRQDVDAAAASLEVIARTSREALTQTRSMLGLLREDGEPVTGPPAAGVGDLADLVEQFRGAGVEVQLDIFGVPRGLDAGIELTAFRIVQESLTNVLRHSGATSARVSVIYAEDTLRIEVEDPGRVGQVPGPSPSPAGHGLIGLRERARLVGGTLDHGPRPGAGFQVLATLPSVPGIGTT